MSYNHLEIDKKWQQRWLESRIFKALDDFSRPKYYALDMFPYPSGEGLHVGHLASYTPTDIIARYKRCRGFNVLHPIGYDAFGLPAEQYAIQTGVHPEKTTKKAISNFREQLKSMGYSFDWDRELSTCDSSYYKWTQYIFSLLFNKGLAYQKEVPVNWCPALKTVLANEEVIDGKSERGGHPVQRIPMKQWMLKITAYVERLLNDLEPIEWPERTKEGQRNWIGKSEGAQINFSIEGHSELLTVFTTRPDTLFGSTFIVLAPEHPLVSKITAPLQESSVKNYIIQTLNRSELDRKAGLSKTGVFIGAYVFHPVTKERIPIWIADYVLMEYGTGAIMAVPAHDERDFEFAQKYHLLIRPIIESSEPVPFVGDGLHINSEFLNGLNNKQATLKMIAYLETHEKGKRQVQYKLRDWLFSRQRYWGEPFPVVHFKNRIQVLSENELPILLPEVADYEPTEDGAPPLARNKEWIKYVNSDGEEGVRESDTMPGSAGSSWYFLRYTDPQNTKKPFDFEKQKYWMPVDLYVGGPEHTVGHLLYARFWQKVLFDEGLVSHEEPFKKLIHQGMILGPDGEKMSKSRGNTINPDEVREKYGADAVRLYVIFLGPLDRDKPWSENGIEGVRRFLDRVWRASVNEDGKCLAQDIDVPDSLNKILHKTIKKVTDDIESMNLNTAVSAMMILANELYHTSVRPRKFLKTFCQLLMPFAPHVAEEIWEILGGEEFVSLYEWPQYDSELVKDNVVNIAVQVNGKMRGTILISPQALEKEAVEQAQKLVSVQNALMNQSIVKIIYKSGKILNLIT